MTYHDFANKDNVALARDQALATDAFYIKVFGIWTPITLAIIYLIGHKLKNPFSGPVADNLLKRLLQKFIYLFTRKYLYYQIPSYTRDEFRTNIFLSSDFARVDRTNLVGYCKKCNLYGHVDQSPKHTITFDSLILAKTCKLLSYNEKLSDLKTFTIHNIKSFEKNSKLFSENFGNPTTIIPSKFALAPKAAVSQLTTIEANIGLIYVNNTAQYPHLGFIAYNNQEQLEQQVAILSTVIDNLMVYTTYSINDVTTMNLHTSVEELTFTNDTDLTLALQNELKDPRSAWLLKAKKVTNRVVDNEDEATDQEHQQKPRRERTLKSENQLLQHTNAKAPKIEKFKHRQAPRLMFGPTFMSMLFMLSIINTTYSTICTQYQLAAEADVYCDQVKNLTQEYLPYYNYEQALKQCFSVDGFNYVDLIRLSVNKPQLNLRNVLKPEINSDIHKALTNTLPFNTYILSTFETYLDIQILLNYYNINISESNILFTEQHTYTKEYAGRIVQLTTQSTEISCQLPSCIYYHGFTHEPLDLEINITTRVTKRIQHQAEGTPIQINPACKETCTCMNKIEPEPVKPLLLAPPREFYTNIHYFQRYELLMYDNLETGVLQYNNYSLDRHIYQNDNCYKHTDKYCVYDPELFETIIVYNKYGNHLECGVNHEFCISLQKEFVYVEEIDTVEIKQVNNEIQCALPLDTLRTKYPKIDDKVFVQFNVGIKNAIQNKSPSTTTFLYDSDLVVKSLVEDLIVATENCFDRLALRLNYTYFNQPQYLEDYRALINDLKPQLEKHSVLVIDDIDKISPQTIQSLFQICDAYEPLVPRAVIIATINTEQAFEIVHTDENIFNMDPVAYGLKDVEDLYTKRWGSLDQNMLIPLIVRLTENVFTITLEHLTGIKPPTPVVVVPTVTPTENIIYKTANTYTHYSAYLLEVFNRERHYAYDYLADTVEVFNNVSRVVCDTVYDSVHLRYNNVRKAYNDIKRNFANQYPQRRDFYRHGQRAFDAGQVCEFLHHTDTIVLYQDCVQDKLEDIYVMKLRYGVDANEYYTHKLETPFTKQTYHDLTEATGFIYKDYNYIYFRPLFTNPGEHVLTIREDYLEYCKSDTSPTPAFATEAPLSCYAYITGVQFLDHFISEFGWFFILYTAALLIILVISVAIREYTTTMIVKMTLIFLYSFGPWLLTPKFYGSYILVKLYNSLPYLIGNSYGCLLVLSVLLITTIDLMSYTTQRFKPEFSRHVLQISTLAFEVMAVLYYIFIPYLFTSYGFVITILVSYVAYIHYLSQRPNYKRSYVTNEVAHADWVRYRNSTREKTDEAAKSNLRKIINTNVADLNKESLLECIYLATCYRATVQDSPFNPRHQLHIPSYNASVMFSRDNEIMMQSLMTSTDFKNKSAASNPSIPHKVLGLPVTINPLITYMSNKYASSLRGSVVNGYIYIQRHLFGSNKNDFLVCYNNGKGLEKCKNLERSKYDIDSAELIGTLIKIPLVDRNSVVDIELHPEPLTYNGPVTLYLSRYDSEQGKDVLCVHTGFMSEGHHDIRTVFGDCGGMLFDTKGRLLGLHCAGSEDVVFMDKLQGKSNIWTSYKMQHPSEIMITLNNEINLPEPVDYDFNTNKVIYHHPLRNVMATLETLQYLTNSTNARMPYDKRLLSDFNITAEQYEQYGLYVDYNQFVKNFNQYTTTLIGTKTFESCIKYGITDKSTTTYRNQSNPLMLPTPVNNGFDDIMDMLYVFIYMFTQIHPSFYVAAVAVVVLLFIKMNKVLKLTLITLICIIPHIYINSYLGLLYLPVKWRAQICGLKYKKLNSTAMTTTYDNQNLKIAEGVARELGTRKNLCTHLSTLLKCIKPYPAFSELSQVVNNVDDLMANWNSTHNAEELLQQYIDEIYKLYPILFVVFEKIDNYDLQIRTILAYISDAGEFDLKGFSIHFDENEHTTEIVGTSNETEHLANRLMDAKASIIALKNMNVEFDIETLNDANIGELVRYMIVSSTPETLDREILTRATEMLVRYINRIRENNETNEQLIPLLSEIYKHKDFLTAAHLTSNVKDKNFILNNLIRVIALFNKQINLQVQQKQIEARRIEDERKKESKLIMEQNNRIRKMQRQNQNIASAIVHMVHACFANRFMLQNESRKIMKALIGLNLELDPSEPESQYYAERRAGKCYSNQTIVTNFTTLTTILWTGNGYQKLPSMCGDAEFVCTQQHKHGYFNCTMEIKDAWYKHVEECPKCKNYYRQNKHPRCGGLYPSDVKRYPTLSNFISRYRSCPSCMPCTQCLSRREHNCENDSYHFSDATQVANQAYLTPINIKPDSLEYNFVDVNNGDVNAVYNGRVWLMRRTQAIIPPPSRYRNITNLKLKNLDPEGYYYISDVCPTDLAILNAMINQIQVKLQERTFVHNENFTQEPTIDTTYRTPINEQLLSQLRENHKYLLVLKLKPDSDNLHYELLRFVKTLSFPVHVCHITYDEITTNHVAMYVNYTQVWRTTVNDNLETTYEMLKRIDQTPLDFQNGLVL
ncbi:ORF1a [Alphamesonivirus casuarinaense]|uniref:ORF1a n=1 Tax=Alphamesonivirus casuarinaense TaxID=1945562 RepID=M4JWT3_9NIDO|nr:ORF1a [Alphamesonivirus 4]AGE00063.1 ORF1a [Alphamesonivirus 4]